jgi:hypothetical protein
MPLLDNEGQTLVGQNDFSGGVDMLDPAMNQLRKAKNIILREGYIQSRPGTRRYYNNTIGYLNGFWFNQENKKYNDAGHTGFWFAFDFVIAALNTIQGFNLVKLPDWDEWRLLIAADGHVYERTENFLREVTVSETIDTTETINFVQENNYILMFRGEDLDALQWDGTPTGFVSIPAGTGAPFPNASNALYDVGGRVWLFRDKTEVWASDPLDHTEWDATYQQFSVRKGDGDTLVRLYPFHDGMILAFKERSIHVITGVNSPIISPLHLSDYVSIVPVDNETGAIAEHGITTAGENVWYLGYGGIYSLLRNEENRVERQPEPVSRPIQPEIDRINWEYAHTSCAITHKNYILFAVPADSATEPNMILVYDLLANGGSGAWIGTWDNHLIDPLRFFRIDEDLVYVNPDMSVRAMFHSDSVDSEDVLGDTASYDNSETYYIGNIVKYTSGASTEIYTCIRETTGNIPTDTTYWEVADDTQHFYDVISEIETPLYMFDAAHPPTLMGRGEIIVEHKDPKLYLYMKSDHYNVEKAMLPAAKEYSQVEYDIAGTADWDESNVNNDFEDPHRKDYTWLNPSTGTYVFGSGMNIGMWTGHSIRFVPRLTNDRALRFRIVNEQGMLRIKSIFLGLTSKRYAGSRL